MKEVNNIVSSVKKGLKVNTIVTTFVTLAVINTITGFAKRGTFGGKIAELSQKYM